MSAAVKVLKTAVVLAKAGTQCLSSITHCLPWAAMLITGLVFIATPAHAQTPQTITVTQPDSPVEYRPNMAITLSATGGGSGNAVVFASTTPALCTVSGDTVSIVTVGYCTLTANQDGNGEYSAAPQVNFGVSIIKAVQLITGTHPDSPIFYSPGSSFNVTLSGGGSGNPVIYTVLTPSVCSVSGPSGTVINVLTASTCSLTANQAGNANHEDAYTVNIDVRIYELDQVITATAPTGYVVYAPTAPDNTFTVSGTGGASGNPVYFVSITPTFCTVSVNVVTMLRAGLCTVDARQDGNVSYHPANPVHLDVWINKANQTISFGALANKALSEPAFTVNATASSGLAITYNSQTISMCTVSGDTVTLVATGTCTIRAAQPGNDSYNAATNVNQSFTITTGSTTPQAIGGFSPATPVVYAPAPGNTFTLTANGGGSGNPVIFASSTTGVCTAGGTNGSTVTIQTAGTCTLTANQAGNSAYTSAPQVTVNVVISKAAQTIAFAVLTDKALSDPAFALTATATSGLSVAFTSTTTPVCTVAANTVTLVAVGTCSINANQAGNGNYLAAAVVSRSFQVPDVPKVYFIHADHLGTPRAITRPSDNVKVWEWSNSDPFGANAPNENPSGLGAFSFNLRFPGQYYDAETGTHFNWNRDYDPATGRYVQSDRIGLRGGINTYLYASANTLSYFDALGLWEVSRIKDNTKSTRFFCPTSPLNT